MAESKELQEIFENDKIAESIKVAKGTSEKVRQELKEFLEPVDEALSGLTQEQHMELYKLDIAKNEEDIPKAAEIIGVEATELEIYLEKSKEVAQATAGIINYDALQKTWEELLPGSGIVVTDFENLCEPVEPYIVFYSATWCGPCKLRKPMYACLAPFFDKASLWFTEDEELAASEGVNRYPTLVAYFPGGTKVKTSLPLSTEELWKTMNTLIDAGKSSKNDGTLECTDTECKIEPW